MDPTLFHIPNEIFGMPVFGAGLLLIVWAVGSALLLTWLVWRQGFNADTLGNIPLLLMIGAAIWLLLPRMLDEKGQGLPIRGYGVMVLVGMALGTALAVWRGRQRGVSSELIFSLIFWMFVPGVIGARLFYVIEYWHDFQRPTAFETFVETIKITEGGLVIYGALLGGFVGLVACIRKYRLPVLPTFDLLAPSVMLGMTFGRIGCLLNGCCFGGVCELPWAIQFPPGSPPYLHQVEHGEMFLHGLKVVGDPQSPPVITAVESGSPAESHGLKAGQTITTINGMPIKSVEWAQVALLDAAKHGSQLSVSTADTGEVTWPITPPTGSRPVHPAQIYSSINNLLICLFLLAISPFCRRDGSLFALLLTIYPITRFLLEIIRTDEAAIFGTGLSISQNVSLLLLVAAVGVWAYVLRQPPRKTLSMAAHGA
jgi:phosphatidylglycerol:prolipoprotein diacylglycerol transferase